MKLLAYLRSVADRFVNRSRIENDTDEELRSHVQHRADDLERSGLDRAEAERRARIEFGGHLRFKEQSHNALGGNFVETLIQDVRYGLRVLRKARGFTFVAVVTLALGIGANAIVFSVMNAFLWRPLNVPRSESLYTLEVGKDRNTNLSYPDYLDLRNRNSSFDGLMAFSFAEVGLDTGSSASRNWIYETSGNYFDGLGIQPYLGQFFHSSDEHGANSAPYAVLAYSYWHNHFQDDRGVVGHVILVNRQPFTVIGVAPPDFHGTITFFNPVLFLPIVNLQQVDGGNGLIDRSGRAVSIAMGHLKSGVTQTQALADLNEIGSYLEKTYPKDDSDMSFVLVRPALGGNDVVVRAFLTGLMLLAALILLAACANLGSLFAARAADRGREIALRLALGAGRLRILRQLFTEAILISLLGGALGLWGSVVLLGELSAWQPVPRFPVYVPVNPDARVYAVALLLAIVAGLLFGAAPVRQILRINPYEVIKSGSTGKAGKRITVREMLLVAQIAICAVLVTASLVAVRGMMHSLHGNFGFEPNNSLLADTDLTMAGYGGDKVPEMQKRIIEAVQTIPGVEHVGLADQVPLTFPNNSFVFTDTITDLKPANAAANAIKFSISPDYFQADGTRLLSGRSFTWHDDNDGPRVAVVNQEFARKIFGSVTNAIGQYYKMPDGARIQVVGIVEDGKYESLTENSKPAMFLPFLQSPTGQTLLVVRSNRDLQELGTSIRNTLRELDTALPVTIQTRYTAMDVILLGPRMATISLGVMGVMGALLAVTGIFGMAAYSVSKRLKEFGIRLALGAQRKDLLSAALGRAFKLLAVGSVTGLGLGILASQVLASIVYQATPRDPIVLAGVVAAMLLLGLIATLIPARRALKVDPLLLLREE